MGVEPEVTVVIPTRSRWHLLSTTLDGALRQEDVELEVVVVDDGSIDETAVELERMPDKRVKVVRNATSVGVTAARNQGIGRARGEWLAFLDDDDLWSPRKLRTQVDAARSSGAAWAYSSAVEIDLDRRVLAVYAAVEPERLARLLLSTDCAIGAGPSNVIASTALVRSLGGFDESFRYLADWDMWIRLSEAAKGVACPEFLVAYLRHAQNMSAVKGREQLSEFERLAAKHRLASLARGLEFSGLRLSRWLAWSQRQAGRRGRAAMTYLRGAVMYRNVGNVARATYALLHPRAITATLESTDTGGSEPPWLTLYR